MFKNKKKFTVLAAALLSLSLVVTGCGNKSGSSNTDVFRFAFTSSPTSLDPAKIEENVGGEIGENIHDGLVQFDFDTLDVIPAIAEDWNISDDGTVYTFYLRKDAKFHDGSDITAEDVVKSWTRVVDKDTASPVAFPFAPVVGFEELQAGETKEFAGVKALDEDTVQVTLKSPDATFLKALAHTAASVYKVEAAEEAGDDYGTPASTPETLIGAGPFKFVSWKADQEIVIERFDDYYGENVPKVKQVVFKFFKDESTALNEFRAGNLEYVDTLPPGQRQSIMAEYPNQYILTPSLTIQYIGFNMKDPVVGDNVYLRKAIAHAIDREAIMNTVLEGISTLANGPFPASLPLCPKDVKYPEYDVEKAKEYLAKAGYPNGQGLPELEFKYNFNESNQKLAEAIQAQLKEIGINVKLVNMEWGAYIDALQSGDSQIFRLGWLGDYPDIDNFATPLFATSEHGNNNQTFFSDSRVDDLLKKGKEELDESKRAEIYKQISEIILEAQPAVYTFDSTFLHLYADNVKNLKISALDRKDLTRVELVEKK